ncbi:MAG: folate-binding protein [Alphaproteobacteria bacterium]|nr:folate-binding protein [Alphaproteobacteria bacterium]
MLDKFVTVLNNRGLILVSGDDARTFLQGVISGDSEKVTESQAIYAAFLTAQGKYLHDFFVAQLGDALVIDCEKERLPDLKKRLTMYKLRSKVTLEDISDDFEVLAFYGTEAVGSFGGLGEAQTWGSGIAFTDPRLEAIGSRAIVKKGSGPGRAQVEGYNPGSEEDYDAYRMKLGLPDGSRDMLIDKSTLLENGFDELNGVDWDKGCYMGQELTARTKHRGLIKKRLMPVTFEGDAPVPGSKIVAEGKDVGEMRSGTSGRGLALIRLEALEKGDPLVSEGVTLQAHKPEWVNF